MRIVRCGFLRADIKSGPAAKTLLAMLKQRPKPAVSAAAS